MRGASSGAVPNEARILVSTGLTDTASTFTVTETTTAPSPPEDGRSGASLNDAGFERMQQGDLEGALPLLEQAVAVLAGSGTLAEAYASYNLAFTRLGLGSCDGVLDLLDRSEAVQGRRAEIDRLQREAERACDGGGKGKRNGNARGNDDRDD